VVNRRYRVRVFTLKGRVKLVAAIAASTPSNESGDCMHTVTAENAALARLLAIVEHTVGACKPGDVKDRRS